MKTTWKCYFSPIRLAKIRQYKMLLLASHSKTQLLEEMDACRAEAEKVNKKDHSVPENEDMSRSDENVSEG